MSTNGIKEVIEEKWYYFIIGAVVIGIAIVAMNNNRDPSAEDLKRSFVSSLARYEALDDYTEKEREEIANCVYGTGNIVTYREKIRAENNRKSDSFIISSQTPVPNDSIYTSIRKFVDGDKDALMSAEKTILSQDIEHCIGK